MSKGSARKLWAEIALEGEKQFKSNVTSCNKSLSALKSELNLVKQQSAGNANSLDNLKKKHQALTSVLDAHVKKETTLKSGLDNAKKNYQNVGTALENYKNQLKEARAALTKMEESGDASEKELEQQRKKVKDLTDMISVGKETYQSAGDKVMDWQRKLNTAQAQTLEASRAVDENAKYMKEAEDSADGCAISIDKYGKKVKDADLALQKMNTSVNRGVCLQALTEITDETSRAIQKLADSAYGAAQDLDTGFDTIAKKTGATGDSLEELNGIAENIFSELPVEMNMVGSAVGEVNTRFGLTGEELQELSEKFVKFAKINDTDVSSSVDTVQKALGAFGLETKDCSRVLDVMTKAGQDSGVGMDELASALVKNAGAMNELGLSVDDAIIFIGRLEKSGVDSETALSGMSRALKNATKEGKPLNEALSELEDTIINGTGSMDGLQASYELFGKSGDKIYNAVAKGSLSFKDLTGSVQDYGNTVENTYEATISPWDKMTVATNNLKSAGSELVGEFFEVAAPVIEGVTGAVKEVKKWFDNLPEPAKKVVAGIGGIATVAGMVGPKVGKVVTAIKTFKVASQASKYLDALSNAQKGVAATTEAVTGATEAENAAKEINSVLTGESATAAGVDAGAKSVETVATEGATVAQEGLNAAQAACPALALAGIIIGLGVALATMAANSSDASQETANVTRAAEEAISKLTESKQTLDDTMEAAEDTVGEAFAKAEIADDVVDKLAVLAEKTSLTADEQRTMAVYVAELNELFPDMGLEIDDVTGKLNMSVGQIKEYVSSLEEMAKAEAYNEAFKESFQGIVEAQKNVINAGIELEKVENRQKDVQEDYRIALDRSDRALRENGNGVIEWKGVMRDSTEVIQEIQTEIHDLEVTHKDLEDQIKDNKDALDGATETAESYKKKCDELSDAAEAQTAKIQENTDAANANAAAKNSQSGAAEYSISVAGQELQAYQALSETQQALAVDVTNSVLAMQESVTGALESQMNMFEQFNAGTEITKKDLLANMQSQVDGVTAWEENMNRLMTETKTTTDGTQVAISEGLMQYLASMGPQGATYVQEFVKMSGDELAKANSLWEQSVNIKSMTNDLGEQLTQGIGELSAGGVEAFTELAESLNMQANESGTYTVQGLVDGVKEAASLIEEAGEEAGDTLLTSIDTSLGVASPSKKTMESGRYTAQGLANGINQGRPAAESAARLLSASVISQIRGTLSGAIFSGVGYNISAGLAMGIQRGRSAVIMAAASVAQAAISAAQSKLEIHSPSHVFQRFGTDTIAGYVKGVNDQKGKASEAITDAMAFSLDNTKKMISDVKVGWQAEQFADAIYRGQSGMDGSDQRRSKTDDIFELLQRYLPYAGTTYLDGEMVSRRITERQNMQSKIRNRIEGVR